MSKIIDSACDWAVSIATDNSHGYDQINRQGPDYDCSSLVINAFEQAGVKVKEAGATFTGNMKNAFVACGFEAIPYQKGMTLKRGDVLLYDKLNASTGKHNGHTLLYLGDGNIVQASINEKGTATGGKTGDQTGREIATGKFYEYSKGWDYVLRYEGDNTDKEETKVIITMTELKEGSKGPEVKTLQVLLYSKGFNCGTADGVFGPKTDAALRNFQKARGLKVDGVCGKCSWTSILAT